MPAVLHRPLATLERTQLAWLSLRDHFVATVGPRSGHGSPLRALRVLADATFAPRSRFALHPHRDAEIVSIVLTGELSHHGDQAHGTRLTARSAQLIDAGTGIVHAEGNDTDAPTRMLQLWFDPPSPGGEPRYARHDFETPGRHRLTGAGALALRTDAHIEWLDLTADRTERVRVEGPRVGYLLALDTPVTVTPREATSPLNLGAGDGLVVEETALELATKSHGAVLWLELA